MSSSRHIERQREQKPGVRGQISRAFGQNRRIAAVVANIRQIYLLVRGNREQERIDVPASLFPGECQRSAAHAA